MPQISPAATPATGTPFRKNPPCSPARRTTPSRIRRCKGVALQSFWPVSYTHLTLPTICSV
eukprot:8658190-Alexandrium_andersonii.AAC.1